MALAMRKYSVLLYWMLFLGILLTGQELRHEVTVSLKLIQVYVTSKDGNPVTDLKPDEFIVYDNRKRQNITEFERHALFPGKDEIVSQPKTKDLEQSSSPDEIMNRKFFLFFDLANNNPKGFLKAQEAALHFINNQLHPSDEISVLSFSVIKGLTLHEYLTKDRQAVRAVVEQIGREGRVGRVDNFEAMIWREISGESALDASQASKPIKNWAPAHLTDIGKSKLSNLRFMRDEQKGIIRLLVSKLIDLSKALRYISGQKHLLFFSSGIPYSLIHGIETNVPVRFKEFDVDTVLREKYEKMLKELSSANVTVFSMNTEALITDINVPSHQKGEATLRRISKYTGGKFLGNVQNYAEILDTVQNFTGSYYVLGYYVDESWDGRYHSIKVEVTRSGCKVFAQRGYFNPKPFSQYSKMEKELHLIDLALAKKPLLQAPLNLPMTAVPCHVEENTAVLLMAKVPGKKIKESIGQKAEIYFLVFDNNKDIIELKRKEVKLSTLKGKGAYYYSIIPLSPGLYKCRIVMRDMETGKGAVGRYSVEIPELPERGLRLFPPFLLAPGKSGLFVRCYVPETGNNKFPLLDYFPFDPAQYSPLLGEIPKGTSSILAVINCSIRNLASPRIRFTSHLIKKSSGESMPLTMSILSSRKEGDVGMIFAGLKMPELEAGEYILVMDAEDASSQAKSQTHILCRVF